MTYTFAQYRESADYIREKIGTFTPKVAMVLGSGLGFLGDVVEDPVAIPYGEIPHFKASTAPVAIVACHAGMEILGFTLLSNMAAGILDQPLTEEEVLEAAAAAREKFSGLVLGCLKEL